MCECVEKSHEILTPSLSITNLAMSEPIDDDQILVESIEYRRKKSDVKPHREGGREGGTKKATNAVIHPSYSR